MRNLMLMVGLGLALAGCNKEPSVSLTNASAEDVAKEAKAAGLVSSIRPGQWETKVELLEIDMPGMDPAMKEQMLKGAQGAKAHSSCITEADVKKPGGLFAGDDKNKCTYNKFEMDGGKVDVVMSCPGSGTGGNMTMKVSGTYSPETITAASEMDSSGMRMKAKMAMHRTGDCKPEAAK